MTNETLDTLKWNVRRRLEFVEFRLFWEGRVNRPDLSDTFGISGQQASTDLSLYQQIAPGNLSYDGNLKTYVRSHEFQPVMLVKSTDRHLLRMVALRNDWMTREETWFDKLPTYEVVSLPRRETDPRILLGVLDAIRLKREIGIAYQSMTSTTQSTRRIAPHALAYSAGRWYVRSWSDEHNDFRDYSLGRIHEVIDPSEARIDYALDYEWHQRIDLEIIPNPTLSDNRQVAVANEYNMVDMKLIMPIRLSLSFYLMSEYNFDVEVGVIPPEKQQIILKNKIQVEQARALSREMAKQALKRVRKDNR